MSLETEFKETVETYSLLINAKVAEALRLLNEAETIAEEHGIPFYSNISPLSQTYTPASYYKKWKGIDEEILSELDIYINEYENEGWEHSAVC